MDAKKIAIDLYAARHHATQSRIGDFAAMCISDGETSFAVVNRAGRQSHVASLAEARRMLREVLDVVSNAVVVIFGLDCHELPFEWVEQCDFSRALIPHCADRLAVLGARLMPEIVELQKEISPETLDTHRLARLFTELLDQAMEQITHRGADLDDVEIERIVALAWAGDPADRCIQLGFLSDVDRLRHEFLRRVGNGPSETASRVIEARSLSVRVLIPAPANQSDAGLLPMSDNDPIHESVLQRLPPNWRAEATAGGLLLHRLM